ncbi:unnamed protein product [marine sediment metagenome]|uniref:Uncharacterized protein n=1 Tax=marine sediment metagenome TaxID=412755 RepID=X0S0Y3_9ZZZZ
MLPDNMPRPFTPEHSDAKEKHYWNGHIPTHEDGAFDKECKG